MELQSLSKKMGDYEEYFSAKSFVTVEGQKDDYSTPSPQYVNRVCVLSASSLGIYADVTPHMVTLESLCTAVVRGVTADDVVLADLYGSTRGDTWFGGNETGSYGLAIEVSTKGRDEGKMQAVDELSRVYRECSVEDWDGCGAEPVSPKAYMEAGKFIGLLPPTFPAPEIIPEPNGEIAFEWYRGKRFVFVASVGGDDTITYAGIHGGTSKFHGTEYLGERLPDTMISHIRRLLGGA